MCIGQSRRIYEAHSLYIKHPIINAKIHFHQHVSTACMHYFKLVSLLSQCTLPVTHFLTTRYIEAKIHNHLVAETLPHVTTQSQMFRFLQSITALCHCNLTNNFYVFWAIKQHLGGNRFKTDGIKTAVREQAFTFISKTEKLIPFYEESVVIYTLPSNITDLLNMTLHATHFSHLDHLQASKYINQSPSRHACVFNAWRWLRTETCSMNVIFNKFVVWWQYINYY